MFCSLTTAEKTNVLFKEKVPRDPGYTWLVIFIVDVAFFISYKRDGIQLSLLLLELVEEQNPGLGSEEVPEGDWKKKQPVDAGRCGKQVMEK